MFIPYDEALGRAPADRGLHRPPGAGTSPPPPPSQYPLLLHFPYFDLYRKQVVKQADLVLAMHLRGDAFTAEQKARNFAYYERAHRPGLLAVGLHPGGASPPRSATSAGLRLLAEAALMDLDDLEHNTRDGLHMAALAGSWIALVAGLGGMRHHDRHPEFAPRLPAQLTRLAFTIALRGRRLTGGDDRDDRHLHPARR